MKKYYKWITAFLLVVSVFLGMTSCQPETEIKYVEVEEKDDEVAPADVTELIVQAVNGNAVLSWKNPADADFAGVQVAMSPAEGTLLNPFILGNDVTSFNVSGLIVGKEYTFTVKSFDTGLNYSEGTSVNAIIALKTIITSVTIPVAGTAYAGNLLPVTINGKNFKTLGAEANGFTSTGATLNNVKIVADTLATAEVTCPSVIGTTNVTVSYGESSATTTLKVIESVATSFAVGDIILTNGTKVSVANVATYTIDENNKPIGVVAMISDVYGVPIPKVIGLQKSASTLMWAPENTTGYNTKFTNIVCTPSQTGTGAALTATFTRDTEGSGNWAEICAVDQEGTQAPATKYPIFNFANTYGTTAGLTGTGYESGWYVPSLAELCEVYKNKEVIQTSLTKAGGFTIGTSHYWSSSQNASYYNDAYLVNFSNGYVGNYSKGNLSSVFVLQALTAK